MEEFSNDCLSMPLNNQLWHARAGLLNNRLNKKNKAIFHLYLSSDLSKRVNMYSIIKSPIGLPIM